MIKTLFSVSTQRFDLTSINILIQDLSILYILEFWRHWSHLQSSWVVRWFLRHQRHLWQWFWSKRYYRLPWPKAIIKSFTITSKPELEFLYPKLIISYFWILTASQMFCIWSAWLIKVAMAMNPANKPAAPITSCNQIIMNKKYC